MSEPKKYYRRAYAGLARNAFQNVASIVALAFDLFMCVVCAFIVPFVPLYLARKAKKASK